MTSKNSDNQPVGTLEGLKGFSVSLATGVDDARASEAGQEIMQFFWAKTRGSRLATRADFTPRDLQKHLPKIALLDLMFDDAGDVFDAVLRVSGSELDAIFGPSTGRNVLDHPSGVGRRCIVTAQRAVEERGTILANSKEVHPSKPFWASRSVNIPLADEAGKITQLLIHISVESASSFKDV